MAKNLALATTKATGTGAASRTFAARFATTQNVLDFGAAGNYSYASDTGTDDTAAIQAAYDAAVASGGSCTVVFPGNRSYKITSTINVPAGVQTIGLGGRNFNAASCPGIFWRGSGGGTMFSAASYSAISFENLLFAGGIDATKSSWAGCAIDYPTGADTGSRLKDVWFSTINGNALELDGVTNFYLEGGRWDLIAGYAIHVDLTNSSCTMQIHDNTWTNGGTATPFAKGFLFLDAESSVGTVAIVEISGLHTEYNESGQVTYASGTDPSDRVGIIRLGINHAINNVQHVVNVISPHHNIIGGAAVSHSYFQCTSASGTLQQHVDRMAVRLSMGRGVAQEPSSKAAANGNCKLLANVPLSYEYWMPGRYNVVDFSCGNGPIDNEVPTGSQFLGRAIVAGHTYAGHTYTTPLAGSIAYITDATTNTLGANITTGGGSTPVLVWYNGTNWTVIGK